MPESVTIIAEAGVNHNGNMDMAFQLIDVAKAAGADFVKFQSFISNEVVTYQAVKSKYQMLGAADNETQMEMLQRLELSNTQHQRLFKYCKEFLNTFLLKLKKLSKILVDKTLTLEALLGLKLPFIIA